MPNTTPERAYVQRIDALNIANGVRSFRKNLKRDLKAGRTQLVNTLLEPPEQVETMKVFDLIVATPKFGRVKANKVLQACRISPARTVGGLSQRQRTQIVALLYRRS